jgi:hypothetical protein
MDGHKRRIHHAGARRDLGRLSAPSVPAQRGTATHPHLDRELSAEEMARLLGSQLSAYRARRCALSWQVGPGGLLWPNTQVTTLTFGALYLQAFSCPYPEILGGLQPLKQYMIQVWPIREKFMVWPPTATIDDRAADGIAGAIFSKLDSIGTASGY